MDFRCGMDCQKPKTPSFDHGTHTQLEYHITRLHLRWFAHDVMVGVTLKHVPTVTNGSANGLIGLLNVDTDTTIGFGEVYTMLEQN